MHQPPVPEPSPEARRPGDDVVREPPTGKAAIVAAVAALGGFLFGFDSSVINGTTTAIQDQFALGDTALGFVVASALPGAAIGAWYAGRFADRYGRTRVMVATAILFVVTSLLSGLAFSWWDLTIWRVLGGMAIGSASVIAPAYIAEIAPAHLRGRLGSLQQLAIVLGILAALLSDTAIAELAGGSEQTLALGLDAWRWMFIAGVVPAAVYGVLAWSLPESPRYLVAHGEEAEARSVLRRFVGGDVEGRVREILRTLAGRDAEPRVRDLRGPRFGLKGFVWVGILLSVFQQAVGINVIFYYSTQLWQSVGFDESQAFLYGIINSTVNVVATLVAIAVIDRIGRKKLLVIGSSGMIVGLLTMAVIFGTAPTAGPDNAPVVGGTEGLVALIAANVFVFSFAVSWGPVVWVLLGEMFPNRYRAVALAVAAAAQWAMNFVITVTFPPLSSASLGLAYGLYAAFAVLSLVFVLRAIEETNGKELEDMEEQGGARKPKSDRLAKAPG